MTRFLKDYPEVSLKCEEISPPLDFADIFGRQGPVHIEIGSGKATFLLSQAKCQPDVNFLGIEWAGRYYRYAVDRIGRWGLNNVRLMRTDAANFIAEMVPDSSIECFHIYFPDPWPKKRHNKRRLICPSNLEQFSRCLIKAGLIQIATDHADYFDQIKECFAQKADLFKEVEFITAAGASENEFVGTNYEKKYIKDRRKVYTLAVRKTAEKRAN